MTINFNFKKYLKYLFIGILCYIFLHSCSSVKAYSELDVKYKVNFINEKNTDISSFLIKGNTSNLDSYLSINYNINNFNNYYDDIKTRIYSQLGYSSWETFTDNNYFISLFRVEPWPFVSSNTNHLNFHFYYIPKNNDNADKFNLSLGASIRSTTNINANQTYYIQIGAVNWTGHNSFQSNDDDFSNHLLTYNSTKPVGFGFTHLCIPNDNQYGCIVSDYNSSNYILSLMLTNSNRFDKGMYLYFTDTNKPNLAITAGGVASLGNSDYRFKKFMLSNNTNNIYSLGDVLSYVDSFNITKPNIQDLGNNSYGINFNSIDNIYLDFYNDISSRINCTNDRDFIGNVCYIYSSDITNFDVNNTNVSNSVIFYLGNSNIILDSSKYYILTFRLYTGYNLDILTTIYSFPDDMNDYPFNIVNKYYKDSVLYKDYSIVFQPTHNGTGNLQFFDIVFKQLNNFTNTLDNDYSFGVFKSVKLSQYDNEPTLNDVQNEINSNSLDTISNNNINSFFTDFNIDDRGLSQIILLPLNFISNFKNQTCSSILLPIPHINNAYLPCVSSFMENNFSVLWSLYKILFNGLLIYRVLISLFSDIKNLYRPDNDRIEVLDL